MKFQKINEKISYVAILALSILFLIVGNHVATGDFTLVDDTYEPSYYSGVVTEIIQRIEQNGTLWFNNIEIYFNVRITDGGRRGEIVTAQQGLSDTFAVNEREVSVGNRVIIIHDDLNDRFFFVNYVRLNYILWLGAVFLVLVIVFGKMKGFNGIISLGFSCVAIFLIFVPAIVAGRNIYATTILVSVYAIVSTLLLVIGLNRKAAAAMVGCLGGVLLAGLLMFVMDGLLGLTGAISHEAAALLALPTEQPLDLRAIIFAGVIFGAVGAIMDVAMSISSALWELRVAGGVSDFKSLMKSGMTIGQDTLGTMLNTLILAYIGSSLSIILLIVATTVSYTELFNMEMIIVEFLRALVGSFGMLLTIPLTSAVCGWLFEDWEEAVVETEGVNDDYFRIIQEKQLARLKNSENEKFD
ncbi:MAG: YibE/F family protein [Turicibacter sp.]|nr:YibE/F family protein [Turicibacter sp.]